MTLLVPAAGDIGWAGQANNAISSPQLDGFRLTLTSATPVTTSDVTGATTIYVTPYTGNRICLYDGSGWQEHATGEISLGLGTLTSGANYDVFVYDNNGAVALDTLVAWTNDTTRATSLVLTDGVWLKSGATTRRYVGTIRTTSTTTTEDSASKRYVYNANNRVLVPSRTQDSTGSWTETSTSFALIHSSAAAWIHSFVVGLDEDAVECTLSTSGTTSTFGDVLALSVSQDGSTTSSTSAIGAYLIMTGSGQNVTARFVGRLGVGARTLNGICLVGTGVTLAGNAFQSGMLSSSLR